MALKGIKFNTSRHERKTAELEEDLQERPSSVSDDERPPVEITIKPTPKPSMGSLVAKDAEVDHNGNTDDSTPADEVKTSKAVNNSVNEGIEMTAEELLAQRTSTWCLYCQGPCNCLTQNPAL